MKWGGVIVREVGYADDITPISPNLEHLNKALRAIFSAGCFNAFKYNLGKCKIIGFSAKDSFDPGIDVSDIKRVESGILLGAVVKWGGLDKSEHVKRRAGMVKSAIRNIKGWRTRGLPFSIAYRQLVIAKVVPRFAYAFSLLPFSEWDADLSFIQSTLAEAFKRACGWPTPKGIKLMPGVLREKPQGVGFFSTYFR